MKAEVIKTSYFVRISQDDFVSLCNYEFYENMRFGSSYVPLYRTLLEKTLAVDVDYDLGFADNGIYYELEKKDDTDKEHEKILKIIEERIKLCIL